MDSDKRLLIAQSYPAYNDGAVLTVLNSHIAENEEHNDGRSRYTWLRLANGDLMLGVYPQGDTYFEVENAVAEDYERADRDNELSLTHLSDCDLRDHDVHFLPQPLNMTDPVRALTVENLRADWNDNGDLTDEQRAALSALSDEKLATALDEECDDGEWYQLLDGTRSNATRRLLTELGIDHDNV